MLGIVKCYESYKADFFFVFSTVFLHKNSQRQSLTADRK